VKKFKLILLQLYYTVRSFLQAHSREKPHKVYYKCLKLKHRVNHPIVCPVQSLCISMHAHLDSHRLSHDKSRDHRQTQIERVS